MTTIKTIEFTRYFGGAMNVVSDARNQPRILIAWMIPSLDVQLQRQPEELKRLTEIFFELSAGGRMRWMTNASTQS